MDKNRKVPELRFKGFTEAWERRKLGDVGNIITGNTPATQVISYYSEDGIPWVTPTDICENITFNTEKKLSIMGQKVGRVVPANTILVTCIASIGKNTILGTMGSFNQQINGLIPNKKIFDPYFLFTESALWSARMKKNASSGTMQIVNRTEFSELTTMVPKLEEQNRLGIFFKQLDRFITLHQRKYDKLVNLKKAMLGKMFPKDGEDKPEIRFKGFTEAWEQRKFSEITFPAGEKNRDNLPLESYSITNENGFVPQNIQFENGGTMREADKRMYYIVSPKSFAYNPARINVGSIGYQDLNEDVIISSLYEIFKTTDEIDDRFLWHWFKSPDFQALIEQLQEGGVRLYFYYDKLCMGVFSFPHIEEQRRVGAFLDNLDHLITLHQCQLEKFQNIKKSLLEKMFV